MTGTAGSSESPAVGPKPTRRAAGLLALTAAAAAMTGGCSSHQVPELADDSDSGSLLFAFGADISRNRQLVATVGRWNKLRGADEQVIPVELSADADSARAQMIAVAQGSRTCYDVMMLDVIWTAEFAAGRYLAELNPARFEWDAMLAAPKKSARYDNKLYAVPCFTNAGLLYVRKDLVDDRGASVPGDLASLTSAARDLGRKNGIAGLTGQFRPYEGLTVNTLEIVRAQGGDLGELDHPVRNPDGVRSGLELIFEGLQEKGWMLSRDFHELEGEEYFRGAHSVFMRNWPFAYPLLAADPTMRDRTEVVPLPWASVLGGENLAISSRSRRRYTAQEFIRFLTNEESQRTMFSVGGYASVRASLYQEPDVIRAQPYARELLAAVQSAQPRPASPYYNSVSRVIQREVERLLDRRQDASVTVDRLRDGLRLALHGKLV